MRGSKKGPSLDGPLGLPQSLSQHLERGRGFGEDDDRFLGVEEAGEGVADLAQARFIGHCSVGGDLQLTPGAPTVYLYPSEHKEIVR